MSDTFSKAEWRKINNELDQNHLAYGLPPTDSQAVIIGTFNIRKLGQIDNRSGEEWDFLARICARFDLLAVQEIMDDMAGIKHLMSKLDSKYSLVISDATGAFPGESGNSERLGYLYNTDVVQRSEVVSDVTYDRSKLISTLYEKLNEINASFETYKREMDTFMMELRTTKPRLKMPVFLSFIRQPYCVAFRIGKPRATNPYTVMAVNAHLLFGDYMSDREQEFRALMEWIIERVKQDNKTYYDDFLLLGDLNLNFDNPQTDITRISDYMKSFDAESGRSFDVNFPLLDPHPETGVVWRTNARKSETFDQIGLFFNDERFPGHDKNSLAGKDKPLITACSTLFRSLPGRYITKRPISLRKKKQRDYTLNSNIQ